MLSVADLACSRGDKTLFTGVNFTLAAGEWLHLQGDNGAGKTSLLRIVCGLSPALRGEVRWQQRPIREAGAEFHASLFYLGHGLAMKEDLSPLENLLAAGAVAGQPAEPAAAMAALARLGLRGRERLPLRVLSQGQKRRSSLARLLMVQSPLWVLDEPFVALDTRAQQALADIVDQHLADGGMALLTSHQALPLAAPGRTLRLAA